MWNVSFSPKPADRPQHEKALYEELGTAILSAVSAGDQLDESFDPRGFARAKVDRAKSDDANARREGHAAAVLLKNARDAGYILGSDARPAAGEHRCSPRSADQSCRAGL
jgi:hypothetical protein